MQPPLWLELEGAVNARDVGGLRAAGGRTTRPGVLIRSDAVHQLTASDVALLTGTFGIRHVIDLRAQGERAEHARGLLGDTSMVYSELDILTDAMIAERRAQREAALSQGEIDPASIIAEGYHQLLELGRGAFVTALQRVSRPDGTPSLVHCSAGKDRTGVLVAMLLDAAGVERDEIVVDYAATDLRMTRVLERLTAMPAYTQLAAQTPAMLLSAHAATMEKFLQRLHDDFGGAAEWFTSNGVSADVLETWRERILAPA